MARVNAFARIRNSAGREVSVGGRRAADMVWGWFNVATAGGDYAATLKAECIGRGLRAADRRRAGSDDRIARFTLTLPEPSPHCEIRIRDYAEPMRDLLGAGAFLVTMREAFQLADGIASGETTDGPAAADAARARIQRAADLVPPPPASFPRVVLPGGVEMTDALAALAWVTADPDRAAAFHAATGKGAR